MTTRNYDWSPLDFHSDPVPGDANYVAHQGRSLGRAAENMHSAASNLRRLESPQTCSEAVSKIIAEAVKAALSLEEAGNRYDTVASALSAYAPTLQWAQSESLAALQAAGPAYENEKAAYKRSLTAYWAAKATIDPAEREHAIQKYHRAKAQQDTASASLHSAKQRLHEAIAGRDGAAQKAEAAVESATHGGSLNDSAWDKFADFMKPVAEVFKAVGKWIWENIDVISIVLTIAATALVAVPVLGQVLAVLAMGAKVLSAIKASYSLINGVAEGVKTGNWGQVGVAVLGLGLSRFGGKAVGAIAKKVGSVVGKGAATGAAKVMSKYNAWLKEGVQRRFNHLQHLALKSHNDLGTTVGRAVASGRRTPYYFKSAPVVDDIYKSASAAGRAKAADADAILATLKGSDYDEAIKRAAQDLAKFGKHHDISAGTIDKVTSAVDDAVGAGVEKAVKDAGKGAVKDAVEWLDQNQQSMGEHRISTTVCGAR